MWRVACDMWRVACGVWHVAWCAGGSLPLSSLLPNELVAMRLVPTDTKGEQKSAAATADDARCLQDALFALKVECPVKVCYSMSHAGVLQHVLLAQLPLLWAAALLWQGAVAAQAPCLARSIDTEVDCIILPSSRQTFEQGHVLALGR